MNYGFNEKQYSADGSMEIKYNRKSGEVEFITYIGGDGYTAPLIVKSDGTTQNNFYLHRDHLGSILAITNQEGSIIEKRQFDAWGNLTNYANVLTGATTPPINDGELFLDRGYTGHEHLVSVGLINMNARLYDPRVHRFLQPDAFVQDPNNTQCYNRYGYASNNPLKYNDPSGNFLPVLVAVGIGALIGAATYTLTALLSDVPFSVGGLLKSVAISAISSAATFGVAQGFGVVANFSTTATGFWQGAAIGASTGFVTGVAGSALNSVLNGGSIKLGQLLQDGLIGAVVGGVIGGIQGQKAQNKLYNGCKKMGVSPNDPVPATDDFLKKAQKEWFPDAPIDKVKSFTVENTSEFAKKVFSADPTPFAITTPKSINGILTGNSAVYFNSNTAFTSAKTLFLTMGHEFVHVSQYAALVGNNVSIFNSQNFSDMLEYHAYNFQHNVLGDVNGLNNVVNEYQGLQFYNLTNYTNFNWTNNVNFSYPLIKK